jgi:pimeloyl-ACP methyl ester carboxylesterase
MPLIQGRVGCVADGLAGRLARAITRATVDTLAASFAAQLGYTGEPAEGIARRVIAGIAPNWVWVDIEPFQPYIAGQAAMDAQGGRFEIVLLENALDETYQDALTAAVAGAARSALANGHGPVPLAVSLVTGNVDMSVPGSPDSLLRADGVHAFLRGEIETAIAQEEGNWRRDLEGARRDADRARRQFEAVDPENRLVARELERAWEERLARLKSLEEGCARLQRGRPAVRTPESAATGGAMSRINVGRENSTTIDLYYEDHGGGRPVVLIHGWPLSSAFWEKQVVALVAGGHRVITYDRRGFGQSSKPAVGYDYDTLAGDLDTLIRDLDLRELTLVGFSMGGGEVARYIGRYGTERVRKAVFVAAIPPFLLKTPDNPTGIDASVFDGIKQAIAADRPAFLSGFLANFYNVDTLGGKRVSDEIVRHSWNVAAGASLKATIECVTAWNADFRQDLARIDVPTLVLHGDEDRIVPFAATGALTHERVRGSKLVMIPGAPHGLNWSHADEVNKALLDFLAG